MQPPTTPPAGRIQGYGWPDSEIALLANWGPICYLMAFIPAAYALDFKGTFQKTKNKPRRAFGVFFIVQRHRDNCPRRTWGGEACAGFYALDSDAN